MKRLLALIVGVAVVVAFVSHEPSADAAALARQIPPPFSKVAQIYQGQAEPTVAPSDTPEPTVAPSETPEPTLAPSDTPEPTVAPSDTPEPTVAPSETPEPTLVPSETPEPTLVPSETPEPTLAPSETPEPTLAPSETPEPTLAPSETPEPTPTPEALVETEAPSSPSPPGAMTSRIVLFNLDATSEATVQIEIVDATGAVAYSTFEQVSAQGAKIVSLPSTIPTGFQGSAVISSDRNVQALVIDANGKQSARDTYEGTALPATTLTLPLFRHLAADTQNTIVAVQNTANATANVTLYYYDMDGNESGSQAVTIPALGSFYFNTNTLFPSSQFVGSARLVSDQNIAAAEQSLYFKDTASFRGLTPDDEDTTLYLPLVERVVNAQGARLNWSETFVRNNGDAATDITIEYYSTDGTLLGSQTANAVPPNGSAQFRTDESAYASFLGNNYVGWAKVLSSGEPIALYSLEAQSKGNRLFGVSAVPQTQIGTKFVCGDLYRNASQKSQITILNTDGAARAVVIVQLYDPETGTQVAKAKVKIAPNAVKTVDLADAKFAPAGSSYQGMGLIWSKGTTPRNIVVGVNTPYVKNAKMMGTTGYLCSRLP